MSEPLSNISLVVAVSENGVIGRGGDLPWHLGDDLRRFKQLTMGHHLIMGRRTYESVGQLLPGRTTIIVTRQRDYQIADDSQPHHIVHDLESALELAQADSEAFIVGGGELYQSALPWVHRIYITRVHTVIENGEAFFPALDESNWVLVSREEFPANKRNDYAFTLDVLERTTSSISTVGAQSR